MAARSRSDAEAPSDRIESPLPEITVCETRPDKVVFLEAGNTDGWIATDVSLDVTR